MTEKEIVTISKFMSLVLRHAPEKAGITLDKNGWANVGELIKGMNNVRKFNIAFDDLKEVVDKDDKRRYSFNDNYTQIRANQGHSINVDVELKETRPPAMLYHGTATRYVDSILREGLKPQSRLYVHLSADIETAGKVGSRHGKPVVLTINTAKMRKNGYKFYLSENGVWLTGEIPVEYISVDNPGVINIYTNFKYRELCTIFDNDTWFIDNVMANRDFLRRHAGIIAEIDNAKVTDYDLLTMATPYGTCSVSCLSTGCKTLLNIKYLLETQPDVKHLIYITTGDKAANAIFRAAADTNISLYLSYSIAPQDFGRFRYIVNNIEAKDILEFLERLHYSIEEEIDNAF
jgi:putative RNA 2'-phosphotransferase